MEKYTIKQHEQGDFHLVGKWSEFSPIMSVLYHPDHDHCIVHWAGWHDEWDGMMFVTPADKWGINTHYIIQLGLHQWSLHSYYITTWASNQQLHTPNGEWINDTNSNGLLATHPHCTQGHQVCKTLSKLSKSVARYLNIFVWPGCSKLHRAAPDSLVPVMAVMSPAPVWHN